MQLPAFTTQKYTVLKYVNDLLIKPAMNSKPALADFTKAERKLIESLRTPAQVQRFLTAMPYNWERNGGTMRSFREVLKRNEAHCLEAAVAATVILEQHGYPPLLLDIESVDLLDHVVFVFQQKGLWGSIGRSRDLGLHGRKPVFRTLRQLVWSYFDPYVDFSGRIKGYGLTSLYELGNYDWSFSAKNMHKIEDHLRAIPHRPLKSSDERYRRLHERYEAFKLRHPDQQPPYYDRQDRWML
ncbi:MAG TPA: hypothetical protein VFH15_11360 [Pyrinomonadaceae bacterium]|nr:hypothetical protein [Pyrinomonadaceae bacterium]